MNLAHFKKLSAQIHTLEKTGVEFDISFINDQPWNKGSDTALFDPQFFTITSLKQLSELQQLLRKPITFGANRTNRLQLKDINLGSLNCLSLVNDLWNAATGKPRNEAHKSLKFYSPYIINYKSYSFGLMMISSPPQEQTEDGVTYRYIGSANECKFCIPHTDPLYNYLDNGHFLVPLTNIVGTPAAKSLPTMAITNELTIDTLFCLYALWLDTTGACAKTLPDHGVILANNAKVARIKIEKALFANGYPAIHNIYNDARRYITIEFEKTVNAGLIQKLIKKEIVTGSYNGVKLTQSSASYETVSLEAPDMLGDLTKNLIFDERTDIYTIVRTYISQKILELEGKPLTQSEEQIKNNQPAEVEIAFTVNKIPITLKRTSANTRRYVNGVMINKDEVEPVCFRASCFTTAEEFNAFVTSVHDMSLKWHDVISNGIGIKIHDGMSADEYRRPEAPLSAPRLRFKLTKEGVPQLIVNDNTAVDIKLNKIIDRVATINRKTTNRYSSSGGYDMRNAAWARREIVAALMEACTFDQKTPVVDPETGKTMVVGGKRQYTNTPVCKLTAEQAGFIEKTAREYQEKAIARSKLMLDKAIKDTGAKLERFKGEDCYIVQGQMRKYAVNAKTNQVFNYDTQGYICIVESGHKIGVGADATVTRLYALKNDKMMVGQIGTLA